MEQYQQDLQTIVDYLDETSIKGFELIEFHISGAKSDTIVKSHTIQDVIVFDEYTLDSRQFCMAILKLLFDGTIPKLMLIDAMTLSNEALAHIMAERILSLKQ